MVARIDCMAADSMLAKSLMRKDCLNTCAGLFWNSNMITDQQ